MSGYILDTITTDRTSFLSIIYQDSFIIFRLKPYILMNILFAKIAWKARCATKQKTNDIKVPNSLNNTQIDSD